MSSALPEQYQDDVIAAALQDILKARLTFVLPVPAPAPGADFTITIPGGADWDIATVCARLVTSAAVSNRTPRLRMRDGDNNVIFTTSGFTNIGAANSIRLSFAAGLGSANTGIDIHVPLPSPPFIGKSGWNLQMLTNGIDVGDQWDQIFVTVRELDAGNVIQAYRDLLREMQSSNA
jgi:hypothetical protein